MKLVFTKKAKEAVDKGKSVAESKKSRPKSKDERPETGTKKKRTGTKKMSKKEVKERQHMARAKELRDKVMTEKLRDDLREARMVRKKKTKKVLAAAATVEKTTPTHDKPGQKPLKPGQKRKHVETDSESDSDEDAPGSSHKGRNLNDWDPADMELAVLVGKENKQLPKRQRIPYRTLETLFHVPKSTLQKRVEGKVKGTGHMSGGNLIPKLFSCNQEAELSNLILKHADSGFPLTSTEVRELGHEYALVNKMKANINKDEKLSYTWQERFLKRNPEVSIKTPQDLSTHRAAFSNEESIKHWFKIFQETVDKYNITSGLSIWNVDETGCVDKPKPRKVYGRKKGKTNQIATCERGITTTAVLMVNAAGMKTPPMVIHKGRRIKDVWKTNKTPKTVLRVSDSGWIEKHLFHEFALMFLHYLKEFGLWDLPHLILLDGHKSHTYNYTFLYEMYKHNIGVLALPPHCSHFIQPLDGPPLANFKNQWKAEMYHHIRKNAGRRLSRCEFFIPFNRAFRAITSNAIKSGFKQCGIWPLDRAQIKAENYAPASILCPIERKNQAVGVWLLFASVLLLGCNFFLPLLTFL